MHHYYWSSFDCLITLFMGLRMGSWWATERFGPKPSLFLMSWGEWILQHHLPSTTLLLICYGILGRLVWMFDYRRTLRLFTKISHKKSTRMYWFLFLPLKSIPIYLYPSKSCICTCALRDAFMCVCSSYMYNVHICLTGQSSTWKLK